MAEHAPFLGETVAVMGLGRAGLPGARALMRLGARVLAWDDSAAARQQAASAGVPLADLAAADFAAIDALLLSPGIPHRLPAPHPVAARALAAGRPIVCDADLLYRAVRAAGSAARFAGVTGTNGKSTTTALLGHILAMAGRPHAVGGNLGTPALALDILGSDGIYALEMSSYMLERIARIRFDAAAMLNLSPDHLDRHGDMAGYEAAKRRIFDRQDDGCTAVVGIDDARGRAIAEELAAGPGLLIRISGAAAVPGGVYVENARLIDARGAYPQRIASLVRHPTLPGAHNAQNAAAAAALALALGIPAEDVGAGIASFPGLPHRQQRVAELDGVLFVNDSKGTNADAAARALACYPRVFWIAGGRAKEGGIGSLAPLFPRIARAFLIGESATAFAATLAAHGVAHEVAETIEAAVPAAFAAARAEAPAVVLLSPAAASFDQFANFEARGEAFRAAVARLARERRP
ncbi:UDP-N-acetylmuramoyl-L-alanine--D-glutamate ligase [Elioraea sp. Yellowstone]|uniref:UDP-N-acetylmuramoyl-L-alanine--D-glutamate ligase n=1 Tax=Elioraea sp. Yellowstone TaxID=2592070 RepID=UPI00115434FF|nr:UDP-N-acetylmuramoyl-L-alanine--D-glutamate ligase [Elioraea sp. Yellowstone]TQF76568.1 UDP-N-acetylmuramoyl-L-alanine--D-glutamate ligase [Elioraea sp. Yellowstone]